MTAGGFRFLVTAEAAGPGRGESVTTSPVSIAMAELRQERGGKKAMGQWSVAGARRAGSRTSVGA